MLSLIPSSRAMMRLGLPSLRRESTSNCRRVKRSPEARSRYLRQGGETARRNERAAGRHNIGRADRDFEACIGAEVTTCAMIERVHDAIGISATGHQDDRHPQEGLLELREALLDRWIRGAVSCLLRRARKPAEGGQSPYPNNGLS